MDRDTGRTAAARRRVDAEGRRQPVAEAGHDLSHQAVHTLSPEHRLVLLAVHCLSASVEEVPAASGVPAGTVKSRAHYARRALRSTLANAHGFEQEAA